MTSRILTASVAGLTVLATAATALAGGLERHGYDVDLLFEKSPFFFDGSVTYVMPNRRIKNAVDESVPAADPTNLNNIPGYSSTADGSEPYADPYLGAKAAIGDAIDCMIDYSEPWGAHVKPGRHWAGAKDVSELEIFSRNYAAACSYRFDAGPGQFRVIGGGFYQEIGGNKEAVVVAPEILAGTPFSNFSGLGRLEDVEGDGAGWHAGVGYEIPEYAMRASLVYTSKVDLGDITGTLDLTGVPSAIKPGNPLLGAATPVYATATMPEVLELKLQSGIAPDWLAFGSVKWTNWSRLQVVSFCPTATKGVFECKANSPAEATALNLYYRDGWTVTGGVGHRFNEQWAGGMSLTWDRGTSTVVGSQSDVWMLGLGTAYSPSEHVELRFNGALGLLTSGESNPVHTTTTRYEYGTDFVSALSGELRVKF